MKVLLIGNYPPDRLHSMEGFAHILASGLKARGIDIRLITPRERLGRLPLPLSGGRKWAGYADKYLLFPPVLRHALTWADVIHICDQGNALYVPYLQRFPHLVTCHDLLAIRSAQGEFADWRTGRTGRIHQHLILNSLRRAQQIVCPSEATRQDMIRISPGMKRNTTVIYNGLYYPYAPMEAEESGRLLSGLGLICPDPFLLHVGGNQPYKNRAGVLRIFAALHREAGSSALRLVMAGKPFTPEMHAFIGDNGLDQLVIEMTDLSEEHLRALYSRAKGLLFPSLYEGFGLPIIEAQACGCPVFTSCMAPMTEVGGDAAVYIDPEQPEAAAQTIQHALQSADRMTAAGYANVRRFTTDRMLEEYIRLYELLIRTGPMAYETVS